MIREICCDIKELILSSGYVNTHFEYCELIKNGDVTYPAQYVTGGNYEQVFNNDVNGNSYVRKNGKVSFAAVSGSDNVKVVACGGVQFVKMIYPLRLVMTVPKSKLSDDAFSDDLLAMEIITLLSANTTTTLAGVRSLEYNVTDFDIDALSIWNSEVKNSDYQMNFDFSYIAINFNAELVINPACLTSTCDAY